jgi:hypothetical protein
MHSTTRMPAKSMVLRSKFTMMSLKSWRSVSVSLSTRLMSLPGGMFSW